MKKLMPLAGIGIFSAIAASLCCIFPVITLLAGIGIASTFSWIEPLRPFFIVFAIFSLGAGWYLKLKPLKQQDCNCEVKPSFYQSKTFLTLVTFLVFVAITFPYYSFVFFPNQPSQSEVVKASDIITSQISIKGMTCAGCEENVLHAVHRLDGIIQSDASFKNNTAHVKFDQTRTSLDKITGAITAAGYEVVTTQTKVHE
ncbi:mercuric transport protein MerTP [bacterium]|nr:mercuric transport protein MerTP [bacterium]